MVTTLAVVVAALTGNDIVLAVLSLLQFHCLLRLGEARVLLGGDVVILDPLAIFLGFDGCWG